MARDLNIMVGVPGASPFPPSTFAVSTSAPIPSAVLRGLGFRMLDLRLGVQDLGSNGFWIYGFDCRINGCGSVFRN